MRVVSFFLSFFFFNIFIEYSIFLLSSVDSHIFMFVCYRPKMWTVKVMFYPDDFKFKKSPTNFIKQVIHIGCFEICLSCLSCQVCFSRCNTINNVSFVGWLISQISSDSHKMFWDLCKLVCLRWCNTIKKILSSLLLD